MDDKLRTFPNYHRETYANEIGYLDEVVLGDYLCTTIFGLKMSQIKTTHDQLVGDPVTTDIKTNDGTVHPKSNYDNTVPLYNHANQRPNYYDFLSLSRDISVANNSITLYLFTSNTPAA